MGWRCVTVALPAADADALGDALLEGGALSVDYADARAGTDAERAVYAEPGEAIDAGWEVTQLAALFPDDADLATIVARAADEANVILPRYDVQQVDEQDWVRRSRDQFTPIRVADRLWVVPSWHEPPDPTARNVVLDPGLAFGTGSHPTTRLCLAWLAEIVRGGETVLDYGCGSGILAIAALKLGAGSAVGVDIDPQALVAAKENARRNGVAARFYDPDSVPRIDAQIVVANILANPLKLLAPLLAGHAAPGGRLALSGILAAQADEVRDAYRPGFELEIVGALDGWVCLAGARRP